MKKILLIIALLISGLGLNAQSATIGGLKFNVTSIELAECEVLGYSGKPVDVTIPSKVTISGKEYSVTSIRGFYHCSSLKSIEIPSGVTSIESSAFTDCSSLTSIDFGENSQLTYIGYDVFYGGYQRTASKSLCFSGTDPIGGAGAEIRPAGAVFPGYGRISRAAAG